MHSIILTGLALASTAISTEPDVDADMISAEIEAMRSAYDVSGLAVSVVSGNQVILAEGFGHFETGEVTTDSQCGLYSATKALTAFTLVSLIEDSALDLHAPLGTLLDDAPEDWRHIPLWRLYNHTSGLPMIINQQAFSAIADDPEAGNAAIYAQVSPLPLDFSPGEHFRYQQSGYAVAEMIAEARLGQSWPALVEHHLTGPAQAMNTVYEPLASGAKTVPMISSAGGYVTSAADMARLFQALNAGEIADRDMIANLLLDPVYHQDGYGLGVIMGDVEGEPTLGHRGGGGRANLRYAPQSGYAVMACTDQVGNRELAIHVSDMVMRALVTGEAPRPHIASLVYGSGETTAQTLVQMLEREWRNPDRRYSFDGAEGLINTLGYDRLEGAPEEARTLFILNTRLYPDSANVWDSLADAQLALGEDQAAYESMRRALTLQPGNPYFQSRVAEHAPSDVD